METVLIGATLIDGTGREPVRDAGIVMKEGGIEQVGPAGQLRHGHDAKVIDVGGLTIKIGRAHV